MSREYSEKERQQRKEATKRYNKKNIIFKSVALNKNTDKEILEHLGKMDESFSGYIHRLILEDIKKGIA